jgi:hypothetical protein
VVSYTDIGGKGVQMAPNQVKIDAENGMSQDTSIPKSVGPEGSHLDRINNSVAKSTDAQGEGDPTVDFDGDEDPLTESDDLDKQLDQFESVEPVEIDVKTSKGDDDEDDKDGDDKGKKKNPFVKEGLEAERGENNSKTAATFGPAKSAVDSGANKTPLPEEDENDDKEMVDEDSPMGGDGSGPDTEKNASGPAAALNKKGSGAMNESLKIRISLPAFPLMEEAGISAKTQRKLATIYESAVKDVSKQISKQTAAHYKQIHESKIAQYNAVLTKQLDSYLGYVVEEWVKTNKVGIRTSLRAQMAESFLDGLKTLFTEHYVDVPQSKVDVVKKLTEDVASMKKAMNKLTEEKMKLRRLAEAANKARIVSQFARNAKLSEAQIVKLEKLAENTAYTTAKEFREKLSMLRESYFPTEKKELTKLAEETVVIPEEKKSSTASGNDPLVAATLAASAAMSNAGKW